MSTTPLDLADYIGTPRIGVRTGLALAESLVRSTPETAPAPLRNAALKVEAKANDLRQVATEKANDEKSDARAADGAMDDAVAALYKRLAACARLPHDRYPAAAEAEALIPRLFRDGLKILRLPFRQEWAAVDGLLRQIDQGAFAPALDRCCGREYLENVRAAFQSYGDALGITRATVDSASILVIDRVRDLQRAMGNFTIQLVAHAEDLEPAALAALLHALDAHREAAKRARSGADATHDAPVDPPSVPGVPPIV